MRSEPNHMNPQQPVLNVAPLSFVPCIGSTNPDEIFSSSTQENAEASETVGLTMNDILNATRNGVVLTEAALTGTMGPRIGQVDIGEPADSYSFRVILAGYHQMKENLDEGNAFVLMPTFFEDQISDLPENFPSNNNTQLREPARGNITMFSYPTREQPAIATVIFFETLCN